MCEDKQKARKKRDIHLSVVCGKAAAISRDLLYVKSITFVCERQGRKRQRLVAQKDPEGKRQRQQKLNSTQTLRKQSCSRNMIDCVVFCVPLGLRSMPCLLNHALCNKTRGPRCVHCVWRHHWCLHSVCLASGSLELTTW